MNWISLKREQPTEDDRYIVSLESGWVGIDCYDVKRKEWFEHQYRVVAWMVLPTHYKECNECIHYESYSMPTGYCHTYEMHVKQDNSSCKDFE